VADRLGRLLLVTLEAARLQTDVHVTGIEHSPTATTGSAWEPTPWRAVQGAAREALSKAEERPE